MSHRVVKDSELITNTLERENIHCIASGRVESTERIYCFAVDSSRITFLVEITLLEHENSINIQVKSSESSPRTTRTFLSLFKRLLRPFTESHG